MSRYHSELDIPVLPEAYLSCFLVARKPPLAARFYIVYIEFSCYRLETPSWLPDSIYRCKTLLRLSLAVPLVFLLAFLCQYHRETQQLFPFSIKKTHDHELVGVVKQVGMVAKFCMHTLHATTRKPLYEILGTPLFVMSLVCCACVSN